VGFFAQHAVLGTHFQKKYTNMTEMSTFEIISQNAHHIGTSVVPPYGVTQTAHVMHTRFCYEFHFSNGHARENCILKMLRRRFFAPYCVSASAASKQIKLNVFLQDTE
jgi:hypothetical protein